MPPGPICNGDVVVLNFPFPDLSQNKRRPALCQITSQAKADGYPVPLEASDFVTGGLNQSSRFRPNRLFTADSNIVIYK